jgi:hypothetical protein
MVRTMNDGKEFEFEVLRLLQAMGFDAEVTGYSQDGGVDLVATNSSPLAAGKCVVQCKARSRPVGEPVLRDLFGTMPAQGANKGILITTSSFTAAALRFAQGKPLELIDGDLYRDLCEQHGLTAYGTSVESLPDVLFDPNSTKVRIKSIDCTDPAARKSMQDYVFAVGQLSIGNCLRVHEPGTDSFGQCPVAERLAFYADAGPAFELRIHKMEEVGTTYDLIATSRPGGYEALNREVRESRERDGVSTEGLKDLTEKPSELILTFTNGIRGGDRYCITCEGRSDVIERLDLAAMAKMSPGALASTAADQARRHARRDGLAASPKMGPGAPPSAAPAPLSSGCLVMLLLPFALAALLVTAVLLWRMFWR